MKSEFASADLTAGQLNAIVKKLGGYEGALRFLRGELTISESEKKWREENGIIYLTVTSDGTSGEDWIARLEKKGFKVGDYAKSVLRSKSFKPTSGITYEIAVLKGEIFSDKERITKNICKDAKNRKLTTPNAEIACLIREKFSDKELEAMGLYWIVTMHESIKDSDGDPGLLVTHRNEDGSWLNTYYGNLDYRWHRDNGFAFVFSQAISS